MTIRSDRASGVRPGITGLHSYQRFYDLQFGPTTLVPLGRNLVCSGTPVGTEAFMRGRLMVNTFQGDQDFRVSDIVSDGAGPTYLANWVTANIAGGGTVALSGTTHRPGGVIITTGAVDNDETQIGNCQTSQTSVAMTFVNALDVGKARLFNCAFTFQGGAGGTTINNGDLFVGLNVGTNIIANNSILSNATSTDNIGFYKAEDSTDLRFVWMRAGAGVEAGVAAGTSVSTGYTMVQSTLVRVGFIVYAHSTTNHTMFAFVNGREVARINATNAVPDATMVPAYALRTGIGAAASMTIHHQLLYSEY